ncbi:MAG: ATP-binding cassette domain-containing protein [Syntrophorhabdaceae bacterium]|nr:ATP-binding cassette domain-containing protein [Syntrophorhabdaceae bacterium]
MIEALRLGIVFCEATLWDGLDFAFEDGSATVIVGPPSCGKTLLLSILRGERKPDAGDVLVSGRSLYSTDRSAVTDLRAVSGFVPERFEADGKLTVNNLFTRSSMVCHEIDSTEQKDRWERLLAMVGLTRKKDARLSTLSSSERVRAALAAELLRSPKVLFMDSAVMMAGTPYTGMMGNLLRVLAGAGNIVLAAERKLPQGWEKFASQRKPKGPFFEYRLPPIVTEGESD